MTHEEYWRRLVYRWLLLHRNDPPREVARIDGGSPLTAEEVDAERILDDGTARVLDDGTVRIIN